jgi:hypothetical protein
VIGPVLYYAPGAGLGHLNRALAIGLELRDRGVDARIVTDSPFASGLSILARFPFIHIPNARWRELAVACCAESKPRAIVTDTFPYGLRDEWREPASPPRIHIARRLRVPAPLDPAAFACILQAEPLAPDHEALLGNAIRLPGPIRLPPQRLRTAVPRALDRDHLTLLVHSGPEEEVRQFARFAGTPCAIVSPWNGIEYYPAVNLYERARRIITAAGYNSMTDGLFFRDRHLAIPMPRRYDDQHARHASFFTVPCDGTARAVEVIMSVVQ